MSDEPSNGRHRFVTNVTNRLYGCVNHEVLEAISALQVLNGLLSEDARMRVIERLSTLWVSTLVGAEGMDHENRRMDVKAILIEDTIQFDISRQSPDVEYVFCLAWTTNSDGIIHLEQAFRASLDQVIQAWSAPDRVSSSACVTLEELRQRTEAISEQRSAAWWAQAPSNSIISKFRIVSMSILGMNIGMPSSMKPFWRISGTNSVGVLLSMKTLSIVDAASSSYGTPTDRS